MRTIRGYGRAIGAPGQPARDEHADVKCPVCGAVMVHRRNRKTGEAFLSCAFFPACRGHAQIEKA